MRLAQNAISFSHFIAKQIIDVGDIAVDATAGNGHDTIFLAELVGPTGYVYAFDIQEQAINITKEKLILANLKNRVNLIHDGHQNLDIYITQPVKLVMFNLGYLPKSNKKIITKPDTTIEAIKKSLFYLAGHGAVILTVYTGHTGGQEEWQFIYSYLHQLPKEQYDVMVYKHLNRSHLCPFTVVVQRIK